VIRDPLSSPPAAENTGVMPTYEECMAAFGEVLADAAIRIAQEQMDLERAQEGS